MATCKPVIRRVAEPGDWVLGVGGYRLQATGRLVFAMRVSEALTYDAYWNDSRYRDKRPVRNGSQKMMVGDNIYHRSQATGHWVQVNSHHSNPDGTPDEHNLRHDTRTDRVLASNCFFYFGRSARKIPAHILADLDYKNGRGHKRFSDEEARALLTWIQDTFAKDSNIVVADPFDFGQSAKRYSARDNRIR